MKLRGLVVPAAVIAVVWASSSSAKRSKANGGAANGKKNGKGNGAAAVPPAVPAVPVEEPRLPPLPVVVMTLAQGGKAHVYSPYSDDAIQSLLAKLPTTFTVTGQKPSWTIDTHNHGVKLAAEWSKDAGTLTLTIANKGFLVPDSAVWHAVDPLMLGRKAP